MYKYYTIHFLWITTKPTCLYILKNGCKHKYRNEYTTDEQEILDSVARLESFRALKLTLLESFRALKLLKPYWRFLGP